MIIVIGPDNTGKTSLVNHLIHEFSLKQLPKFGKRPWDAPQEWADWILNNMTLKPNVIVDRMYFDEFAYGPVMRGDICLTYNEVRAIDASMAKFKPLVIWCDTSLGNMGKTYKDREQYPDFLQLMVIKEKYLPIMSARAGSFPIHKFDWEIDPKYETVDLTVLGYLELNTRRNG